MYGDFSRLTYSPAKAYSGVWSQQGRVQLDADANEQMALFLEWLRTLAVDFIGPFGGHVTRAGFNVTLTDGELTLSPGHYYVYGLRCEVPQPTGGGTSAATVPVAGPLPTAPYLVQLLVWERSVSAVVDPDLLEPALGANPPDTTVRSQVMWAPSLTTSVPLPAPNGTPLGEVDPGALSAEYISGQFEANNRGHGRRPLLVARVERDVGPSDASIVPAGSGYLGVDNQLYRVEVHAGGRAGPATPTFKWSRHNGSVEFGIVAIDVEADGVVHVTVASLGRDDRTGLEVGDWVEVVDDATAPGGAVAPLLEVQAIDRATTILTLAGRLATDMSQHPYLRRWDQPTHGRGGADGVAIIESPEGEGDVTWLELEDGVEIAFPAIDADYLPGDYWLIPARPATGGLLWPGGAEPAAVEAQRPPRYLVPLALVDAAGTVVDLRTLFTHLAWPEPARAAAGGSG